MHRTWKMIGTHKRKKRSWKEELKGLYSHTFTTTIHGGAGIIWQVTDKKTNTTYYTISTYGKRGRSMRNMIYYVYTHYVLNEKAKNNLLSTITIHKI